MKKRILVAVDGSIFSFNALRYLSHLFTDLEDIYVHLLYVVPTGLEAAGSQWLDDLEIICRIGPKARAFLAKGKRFMEEAVLQLGRRGIAPAQVETTVQLAREGAANDILHEARKGLYDALVIGRRGLGKLEKLFLGSVSTNIIDKCFDLPLWVVDGKVNSRSFLLPVDGSFNSLKAADHLGFVLAGNPYAEVVLFHLAPPFTYELKEQERLDLCEKWGAGWCEEHLGRKDSLYSAPERLLLDHGIAQNRITRFTKSYGLGVHRHILRHSDMDNYGTIVVGRRGRHIKKGMLKGVSSALLDGARGVAVWVV